MCSIKLLLPSLHFNPTIHPLSPMYHPLLLQAFVLKGEKILLCFTSEKIKSFHSFLEFLN